MVDLGEAFVIAQQSNKKTILGVRAYLGARISWVWRKETSENSSLARKIDDGKYCFLKDWLKRKNAIQ